MPVLRAGLRDLAIKDDLTRLCDEEPGPLDVVREECLDEAGGPTRLDGQVRVRDLSIGSGKKCCPKDQNPLDAGLVDRKTGRARPARPCAHRRIPGSQEPADEMIQRLKLLDPVNEGRDSSSAVPDPVQMYLPLRGALPFEPRLNPGRTEGACGAVSCPGRGHVVEIAPLRTRDPGSHIGDIPLDGPDAAAGVDHQVGDLDPPWGSRGADEDVEGAGGLLPLRRVGEPGNIRDDPVREKVADEGGPLLPNRILDRLSPFGMKNARDQLNQIPRRDSAPKPSARGWVTLRGEKERGHQTLMTRILCLRRAIIGEMTRAHT